MVMTSGIYNLVLITLMALTTSTLQAPIQSESPSVTPATASSTTESTPEEEGSSTVTPLTQQTSTVTTSNTVVTESISTEASTPSTTEAGTVTTATASTEQAPSTAEPTTASTEQAPSTATSTTASTEQAPSTATPTTASTEQAPSTATQTTASTEQAPSTATPTTASTEQAPSTAEPPVQDPTLPVVPLNSCPGYKRGNPAQRNKTGCVTGTPLQGVDLEMAFGFSSGQNPNWSSCHIPQLPEENQRICYKTTVDRCGTDYRIYLNLRNMETLQRMCPRESESIHSVAENDTERLFHSPRYGCRKGRGTGALYKYRSSDLCLYNVSMPDCESGWLILESADANNREIEQRMSAVSGEHVCNDYVQFFYGNGTRTEKFCDNDLTLKLPLRIPATRFVAAFWTDPSTNEEGFEIRAKCLQL